MSENKKTLLMAIVSWALPVLTVVSTRILPAVFPASDARSIVGVYCYFIAWYALMLGSLAASLALAVVARRKSAASHSSGPYKHATAGLFLSLPLLLCYTGVFVFGLITMME